tara:strand:+ start:9932 stop:11203 length:1272 start_codon:yes stop_codon:yes gene_type:complete
MEGLWLKTKKMIYYDICRFFTKIFALTFGVGVVSGIVMEFQVGTNWSGLSHTAGDILGALFTYEVMSAFFIEAGFLGVMLFGWNKVSKRLHFTATCLVAVGVIISAFLILIANTWMQHPVGFIYENGNFTPDNWLLILSNPMLYPRFFHMVLSAYLATGCVICAISGYYLLIKKHDHFAKKVFKFGVIGMAILAPTQLIVGDLVGLDVHHYQPIKSAAIEGVWNTSKEVPYLIFAIPDQKAEKNYYEIGIPYAASLINTHTFDGELIGLKSVSKDDRPNVAMVFFSFRIMLYLGGLMILVSLLSAYLLYRDKLYDYPLLYKLWILIAPAGFVAMECGWFTAESGRQPWVVYEYLRTNLAASNVNRYQVMASFIVIFMVYVIIFGFFYFKYLFKTIKKGPKRFTDKEINYPFGYLQSNSEETKQ